ncbi:MAG: Crp/Fnr family transcriptional regulator [Bacteroidota bacterium]
MSEILQSCTECNFKSSCFQKLEAEELAMADKSRVQVHYKKGETIAKQGSFMNHILYIKDGFAKIYRENENNTNTIYNIFSTGSLIGLSTLFRDNIYPYSIAALSDSVVCAIDRETIKHLIDENNRFAVSVLKSINEENSHLRSKMISLTMKQLPGRMADTILHLAEEVYGSDEFHLNLSRKDLAEFSGMSTMSVVRTLQGFMKENLIKQNQDILTIIDKSGLKQKSELKL